MKAALSIKANTRLRDNFEGHVKRNLSVSQTMRTVSYNNFKKNDISATRPGKYSPVGYQGVWKMKLLSYIFNII